MGDCRFHLKGEFSAHGKDFPFDMSLNWADTGDGIDESIFKFFQTSYEQAYEAWQDSIYDAETKKRNAEEKRERELLAMLKEKYNE